MKIFLGYDHRGIEAANHLAERLKAREHDVNMHGPAEGEFCDYPEIASAVCTRIVSGQGDVAVLIDATGVGMAIAANKVTGIRAASVHDEITAELSRTHNNANAICLSADLLGHRLMEKIVDLFLQTTFEGGRHERRVKKIEAIERGEDPSTITS
ncbi:MAG: ribose 5-phosphate isomerase B [Planctomycetota bacterium]